MKVAARLIYVAAMSSMCCWFCKHSTHKKEGCHGGLCQAGSLWQSQISHKKMKTLWEAVKEKPEVQTSGHWKYFSCEESCGHEVK